MKLTVKNYKEATKNIDFKKLPKVAQETHEEFDEFADFYNDDKDIKEMLDNHFKLMEKFINEQSESKSRKKSTSENKKEPSKRVIKLTKTGDTDSDGLPIYKGSDRRIYKDIDINDDAPDIHAVTEEGEPWYSLDESLYTIVKKKTSSRASKSAPNKKAARKTNEVSVMPEEIKLIKRYLGFDGKFVTERQVALLYRAIQKAAVEKTIRKTSKYSEEIKKVANDLVQTYKDMGDKAEFVVPQELEQKLKTIVESYGVTPAISLIKRFINLYGNITKDKAQRLLTAIKNAKKNGKVNSKDEAYEKINQVVKHLEGYIKNNKLQVTSVQLNGLKGISRLGK